MNYNRNKLQLISRNEGKIKSYDSSTDVRAWSHDLQSRDYYLRDWMRSDMPICVIPVYTVTGFYTKMTRRNHTKLTPSCQPECKSKLILETVSASCHAIRECLKNDETFEKYFQEEELETGHWPCDKCLSALKSIKMFWRIILDKLFGINMDIEKEYNSSICSSVRSIAKSYLHEINEQTIYLRKILSAKSKYDNYDKQSDTIHFKIYSNDFVILTPKESKHKIVVIDKCVETVAPKILKDEKVSQGITVRCESVDCGCQTCVLKELNTHRNINNSKDNSQNTDFNKVTKLDKGCETCEFNDNEIQAYKNNIDILQNQLNSHSIELAKANKENISLKLELQQIYRNNTWSSYHNQPNFTPLQEALDNVPPPFESIDEEDNDIVPKTIDSEMIITLRNCKNEAYKNISLLQVVHKSNNAKDTRECSCHEEDPIKILTKVQNTFGDIVEREMAIINDNRSNKNATIINSSYVNVESAKTQSAGSTLSLHSISSETVFVTTTD
ncbi:uncharacterized protein LOC110994244 isoform X2 [Pieris rapae]|uniref:uncharacterized protein LOC110994244 isoform X2 n=1 Tax=Pieris rapae TaxID=64459 RepID=UPI001E27C1A7|nr:uncharacterized protein LOC110994244 isoform X2 [Pieris rapae]